MTVDEEITYKNLFKSMNRSLFKMELRTKTNIVEKKVSMEKKAINKQLGMIQSTNLLQGKNQYYNFMKKTPVRVLTGAFLSFEQRSLGHASRKGVLAYSSWLCLDLITTYNAYTTSFVALEPFQFLRDALRGPFWRKTTEAKLNNCAH